MRTLIAVATLAAVPFAPALAQEAPAPERETILAPVPPSTFATAPEPAVAIAPAPATESVLRVGLPIQLRMAEELTTKKKKLKVGQRFNLEVAETVQLNGATIIPVGSPAVGEITEVRNKGMWGKSGYIGARLLYIRVGDRQVRISGALDDKGVTGTAGVVGAVAFVPVAGFLMTGTSAKIPLGTPVKAFLDEDLAVTALPARPLAVPAAAVAPAVPAQPATQPF